VFTVSDELWPGNLLRDIAGVHVVHLQDPPPAREVVESHLIRHEHAHLVPHIQTTAVRNLLLGLNAVEATQAVGTIIEQSVEYSRREQPHGTASTSGSAEESVLTTQICHALADWSDDFDTLFDELNTDTRMNNALRPLALEDRCLLLATLLGQRLPAPEAAEDARALLAELRSVAPAPAASSDVAVVFAGRGLRRRIKSVGASVDSRDWVRFDRPGYRDAALAYVWDNYELMRSALLSWLVTRAESKRNNNHIVDALSDLILRHGDMSALTQLRPIALKQTKGADLLARVVARAVRDEHVGPLAWNTLYTWASQSEVHPVVTAVCRGVLEDHDSTPATRRMAIVRLRHVVQSQCKNEVRNEVLGVLQVLAKTEEGLDRLMDMIEPWMKSGSTPAAGMLAVLALMPETRDGVPWLLSDNPPAFDVDKALGLVLADKEQWPQAIPYIAEWLHVCVGEDAKYEVVRDRILNRVRLDRAFAAGLQLMSSVGGLHRPDGTAVADDILERFGDPRVLAVFQSHGESR
jgi:hypothetical protein